MVANQISYILYIMDLFIYCQVNGCWKEESINYENYSYEIHLME